MSVEDRVRTAAEATAASVRQVRPLTLPDNSAVPAEPRGHRGRNASRAGGTRSKFRQTWLIPLSAAAAVVAVALSLVIIRHEETPSPAPANAAAVAAVPRYYATAYEGPEGHDQKAVVNVTVGDVRTGKALATVATPTFDIPDNSAVAGVSATAGDRSFVVGTRNIYGAIAYYLVRIAPGTKQAATIAPLPIPPADPGDLLSFAVSPDGEELAALSVRGNGTTLRIYSVKSGATLRTWTAATWHYQSYGVQVTGVSWTADSRQVAFSTVVSAAKYSSSPSGDALQERIIAATAPSGDLATASKIAFKAPGDCTSLLLTPDGGTVVCATQANTQVNSSPVPGASSSPTSSADCAPNEPMFAAYSVATGKLQRVLYHYTGSCVSAMYTVLWTDDSAQHVIGETNTAPQGSSQYINQYGVAAAGNFTKFHVIPPLSQWNSGPAF